MSENQTPDVPEPIDQGTFIVFRPSRGENMVVNRKQPGDIELTPEEVMHWYAAGDRLVRKSELEQELREIDFKRIRALAEGGLRPAEPEKGIPEMPWLEWYNSEAARVRTELATL